MGFIKVISIVNQKGGVGKTTTALTLGESLAFFNKKTLVIDLDPHACATIQLNYHPNDISKDSYELFKERPIRDLKSFIHKNKNHKFDFIPASINLSKLEIELKDKKDRALILKRNLAHFRLKYDYILLDCPPHLGIILINAIAASDLLIIPTQTEFLALHGLKLLFNTIGLVKKSLNKDINYKILPTMHDKRIKSCQRILFLLKEKLNRKLNNKVFSTVIHIDSKFKEAARIGGIILNIFPKSRGSKEYIQLAREILALDKNKDIKNERIDFSN